MADEDATAVKEEAVQAATPEPATEEVKETPEVAEAVDTGELSQSDIKEESPDPEADQQAEEPEPEKPRGAEKRKQQLEGEIEELKTELKLDPNTEIRDLVSARNALKRQVEQANSQAYRVATEQELLDQINPETNEYYSPLEAKVTALEQKQELQQYNERVADAQLTLMAEAQRAVTDFPMFDQQSPEYNEQVASEVDRILGQSLVFDPATGQVIGSHVSPYQLYKSFHDTYQASAAAHQIQGQKATEAMLASADNVGGAPQVETPFDKLSTEEMRQRLRAKGHDV